MLSDTDSTAPQSARDQMIARGVRHFSEFLEQAADTETSARHARFCLEQLLECPIDVLPIDLGRLFEHWELLWDSQGYEWIREDVLRWLGRAEDPQDLEAMLVDALKAMDFPRRRRTWLFLTQMADTLAPETLVGGDILTYVVTQVDVMVPNGNMGRLES